MSAKETIEELKEKIEHYERLLEQFLQEGKKLIKVVAGPIEDAAITYFRGAGGELLRYAKENLMFNKEAEVLIGSEVVVRNNQIVAVVPVELMEKKAETTFKQIKWDEIGGIKSQVKEIKNAVELPLQNEKLYKEFGAKPIKGILLYGPPGCGKTLIGKAIASAVLNDAQGDGDCFIYVKGAELLSPYVGMAELAIGGLFKQARAYHKKTGKRAVIFIDEAEALLPARGSRVSSDVDTTIVPTFLSEMDGLEDGGPLMVLSTNLPRNIDEAILRDGRIDLRIEIKRPTQDDAEDIFDIHLNKVHSEKGLSKKASEMLFKSNHKEKVSGAMIEGIVKKATQQAITRSIEIKKKSSVKMEDLEIAIANLN